VSPESRLWLLSPRQAIASLIAGHELSDEALGQRRCVNLPGISVSVQDMVDALARVAGAKTVERIRWQPDPVVERIVGGWPAAWDTGRANELGLTGDADFESIVRAYVEDDLPFVQ
jgi:nucleoside-diphosphate-sugar epimerase